MSSIDKASHSGPVLRCGTRRDQSPLDCKSRICQSVTCKICTVADFRIHFLLSLRANPLRFSGEGKTLQRYKRQAANWNGVDGVQAREAHANEYSRASTKTTEEGNIVALQGNAEQADLTAKETLNTMIFIKNLPFSVDWQTLKDLCLQFGTIIRCEIGVDRLTGKSKGFATARFRTKEDATSAIRGINAMTEFHGRKLTAAEYKMPPKRTQ